MKLTLLSPSVRQLWRIDKSTPQKAEVKKQQVEKTWSQSLYSFSLTFNAYISVQAHTHTHTHMQTQTQVYTHTMNTHIHSLTQLHSAHVWNEQGSYLLETHHWARGEVERGRHTAGEEGGEKEGGGGGERLRERERAVSRGVHADDCGLGNLLQTLEVWGWAIIKLLPLLHPLTDLSKLAPHPPHTNTHT